MKFANEYNVSKIVMSGRVRHHCPLGKDWVSTDITIEVENPKTIPDYCDVTQYLTTLDGRELILENLCWLVHKYAKEQTGATVTVHGETKDAVHIPAVVSISG